MLRLGRIEDNLTVNEFLLADKGYIGHEQCICPIKGAETEIELAYNSIINSYCVLIENVLGRFKVYKCLSCRWRHWIELHPIAFYVIAEIVNIDLLEHPMR